MQTEITVLTVGVDQAHRLLEADSPGALDPSELKDLWCAQFQVQCMKFVFNQLQGKAQVLVAKMGIQMQCGVFAKTGEQGVGCRSAVHAKSRGH